MPVVWESPVPIDEGPAQSLACFVQSKVGAYAERSIEKPVQEFTQSDANDNTVVIWWVLVKRDWEDFQRRSAQREFRVDEKGRRYEVFPMWAPSVMHFGDEMVRRMERYQREEYDAGEVVAARAELQALVGFSAYAYRKHELR